MTLHVEYKKELHQKTHCGRDWKLVFGFCRTADTVKYGLFATGRLFLYLHWIELRAITARVAVDKTEYNHENVDILNLLLARIFCVIYWCDLWKWTATTHGLVNTSMKYVATGSWFLYCSGTGLVHLQLLKFWSLSILVCSVKSTTFRQLDVSISRWKYCEAPTSVGSDAKRCSPSMKISQSRKLGCFKYDFHLTALTDLYKSLGLWNY